MKVIYKGFEIFAHREDSSGGDNGDTPLRYFIIRVSDGFSVISGFSYGTDKVRDFITHLKGVADDFLNDPKPYYKNHDVDINDFDDEQDEEDMYDDETEERQDVGDLQ